MYQAISYCIFTGSNYLACRDTGKFKQAIILENSDSPLEANSMHLAHNFPKLRILTPSQYNNERVLELLSSKSFDYMFGNPNCSGLSMINRSAKTDSKMNVYMHEFFNLVGQIGPKVFFMENAPQLTGRKGWPILKAMVEGLSDAYTFTVCRDWGKFHGTPMARQRSLILGFRKDAFGENVFSLEAPRITAPPALEVISGDLSEHDLELGDPRALKNAWDMFITENFDVFGRATAEQSSLIGSMTLMAATDPACEGDMVSFRVDNWEDRLERSSICDKFKANIKREKDRIVQKINDKKSIWDKSSLIIDENTKLLPSLTATAAFYNANAKRGFTMREYARVMGYPEDFEFKEGVKVDHIAQGVPYHFAKFVHERVAEVLEGKQEAIPGQVLAMKNGSNGYLTRVMSYDELCAISDISEIAEKK